MFLPGGAAPTAGHGALTLGGLGGFGFGLGFGSGFGWWATGLGVGVPATGCGVGAGVGRAVGAGVGAGVGCAVGAGVGAGVGCAVGAGVGTRSVRPRCAGAAGVGVAAVATVGVPAGVGETAGLGSIDGDGLAAVGPTLAGGWDGVVPGGSDVDPPGGEVEPVVGRGVAAGPPGGTTAIGPARCRGPLLEFGPADAQRDRRENEIQDSEAHDESNALACRHGDVGLLWARSVRVRGASDGTRREAYPASLRVAPT